MNRNAPAPIQKPRRFGGQTNPLEPGPHRPLDDADASLAFSSEADARASADPPAVRRQGGSAGFGRALGALDRRRWGQVAVIVLAVAGCVALVYARWIPLTAAAARPGTLTIETVPAGAEIAIDGQSRGPAPVSVSLASGTHSVTIRRGSEERVVSVDLAAGAQVTHHVEFGASDAAAALGTGGMSVVSTPPGAQVRINGEMRGTSPLALTDLKPADYKVSVSNGTATAEGIVSVKAGATASASFSLPRTTSGSVGGFLAVSAPFDVEIRENGNVIGVGKASKIMMPAGRHTVSVTSETLRYESTRTVDIGAGGTVTLRLDVPKVAINVNARPWADVSIDGVSVGQTPIANLSTAIGAHEVVFTHPQFGERRQTVVVTNAGPNRITADLTKPIAGNTE